MLQCIITPEDKIETSDFKTDVLIVSELFTDTFQGEGIYTGHPATFLRLKGCAINCAWCDSQKIWSKGSRYTFKHITELLSKNGTIRKLKQGQHLVITGGSPVLQVFQLSGFLHWFKQEFSFLPFIEIENECSELWPEEFVNEFDICWNNSPKLSNSGISKIKRFNPSALKQMNSFKNSSFKFVINGEDDWKEIVDEYLETNLIDKQKIILMPEGYSWETLTVEKKIKVAEIAMRENVRYSGRLQIDLFNTKTGV